MTEQFSVVVLSGARQVGKSTLLQHALPGWAAIVLDPAIDVGGAREDPDLFLDNHPPPLILDEIQYAPELVAAIKRRIDRDRGPGRYVLTGSQQWSVLRTASESLAGRAVFLDLGGFALREIAERTEGPSWLERYLDDPEGFSTLTADRGAAAAQRLPSTRTLYEQLWRGFLPEADALEERWIGDFLRGYLRTYIERDVRLIADVGDWQQFGRFVQLAAALSAQEVNRSQFGREIGVAPQTATRWLATLRSTFQWHEIPAHEGNTIKRISGRPKGCFADTGLICAMNAISSPRALAGHPMVGSIFETAVIGEVIRLSAPLSTPPALRHWRTHGGAEVDLILERDGRLHPIEIKLTTKPGRSATHGIAALRQTYPSQSIAPALVVCPTDAPRRLTGTEIAIPWDLA
jgi:predicted AAA+ superfamily ATPase